MSFPKNETYSKERVFIIQILWFTILINYEKESA
jgi:hypothetical protein